MSVELYAFTCGFLTLPKRFLLAGATGVITVPVPSYLVVHPKGKVLFDSGLHEATLTDPAPHVGEVIAKYHQFHFHIGEQIAARLRAAGFDPAEINFVVNSHLHFDHCGGNAQLPNADIVLQSRELAHARAVLDSHGYVAAEWDTGQTLRAVDGEYDIFGDGAVVCLPTYGHTPGHQSLRVRTLMGGEFILCGDACYLRDSLENLHAPGIIADREAALAVFQRFREMQARGARILFGHDPDFWKTLPQAPVRLG